MTEKSERGSLIGSIGLELPAGLPFAEWSQLGVKLRRVSEATTWALADWARFGADTYPRGRRYTEAMRVTGLDYATLRNYAYVAGRFPIARRRPRLSFGHHVELASLPEAAQDEWADEAEENGWSSKQLRDRVRASRCLERGLRLAATRRPVTVEPSLEQITRWEAAARRRGLALDEWLTAIADEAAADLQLALP